MKYILTIIFIISVLFVKSQDLSKQREYTGLSLKKHAIPERHNGIKLDTIKCLIDTGTHRQFRGWAVVEKTERRTHIDPGYLNFLRGFGYDVHAVLLNNKKTKVRKLIAVYPIKQ